MIHFGVKYKKVLNILKPKIRILKSKKASDFKEFVRNTNYAWGIDDEDEDFLSDPVYPSSRPSDLHSTHHQFSRQQQQLSVCDTSDRPDPIREDVPKHPEIPEEMTKCGQVNHINTSLACSTVQKQQPHIVPLVARISDQNASGEPNLAVREKSRLDKFKQLLASPIVDLVELRKHSWSGIPIEVRPIVWRLLCDYLPANVEQRELVLKRKRDDYFGFTEKYNHFKTDECYRDSYKQIQIDTPRTNPLIPLFQQPIVQELFERILFIWAIQHPASGYVQGMNDLVTPFFVVFLSEFIEEDMENFEVASLPLDTQRNIEADSFWCMSKLLDGIQDHYTSAQPGILNKVKVLDELVSRIDEDIHGKLLKCEVEYLQFAFRWMNNLLMRELPLRCTIRLWDTYQAEAEGFSHFHLYVCVAFLIEWRKEILSRVDFQDILLLLQNLPTIHWGNKEVGVLLAEAYRLQYMFADAPNHYKR